MKVTTWDNSMVWGAVVGVDPEFPNLLLMTDRTRRLAPGMLVTCYEGTLHRMIDHSDLDRPGLGAVLAVESHPRPKGDTRSLVTVLWNW